MRVEIIPTKNGKVVIICMKMIPDPQINPVFWNQAINETMSFLEGEKLSTKEFKRGDEI